MESRFYSVNFNLLIKTNLQKLNELYDLYLLSKARGIIICGIKTIISYPLPRTLIYLEISMHHICDTLWPFPPKEELQLFLENYRIESDALLQNKEIITIFASALANCTRSPSGLSMNINLIIKNHKNEIPPENHSDIFKLFNRVLRDIAIKHSTH